MPDDHAIFHGPDFLAFLEREDVLSEMTIKRVLLAAEETNTSPERVILELGLLEEDRVYSLLAAFQRRPYFTVEMIDQALPRSGLLKPDFMKRAAAIPVAEADNGYVVATANPDMQDMLASIAFLLDAEVKGAIASPTTIETVLNSVGAKPPGAQGNAAAGDIEKLRALANDGPIIGLVNDIIAKAVGLGASDIHVEAQERGARVRLRVDGVLRVERTIPDDLKNAVTSRLKIMANLNISEKRRPQDGRAEAVVRGRSIDIRLSTLPTQYGESIVLRLLDRNHMRLDWSALKFPDHRVAQIEQLMAYPNGIFLVAGPTGSGKTTTLYTALQGINSDVRKIVTVEDPIEYAMAGINQVQVDTAIDMSFATALRAILRQDPNVVMVGEIRDEETAEIAVRAALIGRLVLSTIHTNDAVGAVDRLMDLGVAPYLVGATLRGVLSQRLVRTNCPQCQGDGCEDCAQSGQSGRMAVSEMLMVSEQVAQAIGQGSRGGPLANLAQYEGFRTIAEQGKALVADGVVSETEMFRALGQSN